MAKTPKMTREAFATIVESEAAAWMAQHDSQEKICALVRGRLNAARDSLLKSCAGIDMSDWNGARIDHCNGRMSAIDDLIRRNVQPEVDAWLVREFGGKLPTLSPTDRKALKAAYMETLRFAMRKLVQERAHADAAAMVDAHFASVPSPASDQKGGV